MYFSHTCINIYWISYVCLLDVSQVQKETRWLILIYYWFIRCVLCLFNFGWRLSGMLNYTWDGPVWLLGLKALSHCAVFRATCLTAIARQVARIIAQCNIPCNSQKRCETSYRNRCGKWNWVLIFFSIAQCNICPATCVVTFCNTSQGKCSFSLMWSSKPRQFVWNVAQCNTCETTNFVMWERL